MTALLAVLRSTAGIAIVSALLAGSSGVFLGWRYADALGDKRVALCNQRSSEAVAAAERESRRRFEAAQAAGDAALAAERARSQAAAHTTEELRHALKRTTSDRACLGGAARRLLNQSPGIAATGLPAGAGRVADPAAAAAADTGIGDTSEADTADWIAVAAGQYEACRARIDAIADWQRSVSNAR